MQDPSTLALTHSSSPPGHSFILVTAPWPQSPHQAPPPLRCSSSSLSTHAPPLVPPISFLPDPLTLHIFFLLFSFIASFQLYTSFCFSLVQTFQNRPKVPPPAESCFRSSCVPPLQRTLSSRQGWDSHRMTLTASGCVTSKTGRTLRKGMEGYLLLTITGYGMLNVGDEHCPQAVQGK